MLNVFQSNRLEVLVTVLAEQVKLSENDNVFAAETIMVHSPGMSQWLKLELAKHNGITANVNFPLPSSFIWKLYQGLLEGVPAESPFNKDKMTWRIFELLPKHLNKDEFVALRQYLETSKSISKIDPERTNDNSVLSYQSSFDQLRRYQLAEKIADVFDNYLMYRQHWLDYWIAGHNDLPADGSSDSIHQQQWQALLWRDLVEEIESSFETQAERPLSRAQMHYLLLDKLSKCDAQQIKTLLPQRLFVFGISSLPKHQFEVLKALSEHVDVFILWLNPCSLYWGDILSDKTLARIKSKNPIQASIAQTNIEQAEDYYIVGNPLLASWGKVGRDYLEMLTTEQVESTDLFIEQASVSVLEQIQQDILRLEYRSSNQPLTPKQINSDFGKRALDPQDDSLLVHNCHSRIRELEVLKDKLLGWFSKDEHLLPKDILIMVPDVDQYTPFIEAVFAGGPNNQYIPFTIADRGGLLENPLLNTFNQLLGLPNSRFNASELIDYLEVPALLNRFELNASELVLVKRWISDCQIKWAKNAAHKAEWGLPKIDLNTWAYGLKRMLLGLSLGKDEVWHNTLAYRHIEGLNATVLGKLLNFFSFIVELERLLQVERNLADWHVVIEALIQQLFGHEYLEMSEQITVQKIREVNHKLLNYQNNDDFNGLISFQILQNYFMTSLNDSGVVQRFLAGSMNFCTLMPMRSVPFKVVCVLGLNEGDYPRQVDPISFDLVGLNQARKGDRSRKFDDRYLFLEALISARQKLHLSYVGQSSKNNQELMPSVILSELIDYCDESFTLNAQKSSVENNSNNASSLDQLVIKHKLQPFNSKYYDQQRGSGLYTSYNSTWFEVLKANLSSVKDHEKDQEDDPQSYIDQQQRSDLINNVSDNDHIDLNDLIQFWTHPIKYFYRNVLDIKLDINDENIDDHETFHHDGLTRFQVLSDLVIEQINGSDQEDDVYLRAGSFPNKSWGESLLKQYKNQAANISNVIRTVFGQDIKVIQTDMATEVKIDGSINKLVGSIPCIETNVGGAVIFNSFTIRTGDIRHQDQLKAWLEHLIKSACQQTGFTVLVDKKSKVYWFEPMQIEQAQKLLQPWVSMFNQYQQKLLRWHVVLGMKSIKNAEKGLSEQANKQILNAELTPGFNRNLSNDEYITKVLQNVDQLTQEFDVINRTLLFDLNEQYQVQGRKKLPYFGMSEEQL